MNKEEAKQALREGKRLTHPSFTAKEWVEGFGNNSYFSGFCYMFEDGIVCPEEEFWLYRQYNTFNDNWREIPKTNL